mmetsp:Transcript_6793/g.16324  ORF Transcript_6793/g.16324 Transcript_6793/m.16324 type:complete len:223 (+) Transcript_6793:156-824(+)
MSDKLTEDEVADLKEAFAMFDINGDGTIELHEIRQVMRKLGQNPTDKELNEMISTVDSDGDKEIDFEEFLILMKSRTETDPKDPDKELRDAFAVFDTDGSGSIDKKELKRLMKKLGQALTEAEVDAMMEEVDSNGDGEISYEEFKSMMVSKRPRERAIHWSFCFVCLLGGLVASFLRTARNDTNSFFVARAQSTPHSPESNGLLRPCFLCSISLASISLQNT